MITRQYKEKNDHHSMFIYKPDFLSDDEQTEYIDWMNRMNDFRICKNYNDTAVTRYQKWYQKDGEYFCRSWKNRLPRWESFEYDDILQRIENKVRTETDKLLNQNIEFNSCLINRYDSGSNYIRKHRDSKESFGEYPTIVGLSLGGTRKIDFTRIIYNADNPSSTKEDKEFQNFGFTLEPGSMFIMAGSSQKYFIHSIPKMKQDKQDKQDKLDKLRYSLTFRKFLI